MRLSALILVCVLVAAARVVTQNSTADGVRAFFQGDFQAAARILRPLAEERPDADPQATR